MAKRYRAGLEHPAAAAALAQLKRLARGRTVTVLCSCADETRCHRGILRSLLRRSRGRAKARGATRPRARSA
jgi:uncharacterized protein YeaO (DUF488 family)